MKTIAIIPARKNSQRLPAKNYRLLGEIPLIAHSILYAQENSHIIDEIYVTTDCPEVKAVALQYGALVIDRPEQLAGDFEPTVSALKHVLENIQNVENVLLLQATNPLRPKDLLQNAFSEFRFSQADSLFTVTRNHQKLGRVVDNKFVPFNYNIGQRSQDLEPLYYENGLVYISRSSLILSDKIISENAVPFIVDHPFAAVDIDTQQDFDYAEFLLSRV